VKVKKSGAEEEEIHPFSWEERDRIIKQFRSNRYYKHYAPLIEFLLFTRCRPFTGNTKIISPTFPTLDLTAAQILSAGK
jgi:hypothetical protein